MGKFDDIMEAVNKKYKGKYMTLGSDAGAFKMERLPTGILAIDAITYGGLPKGKIVVFWGNWSSAKTFTAFKTVARAQRTCKQCLAYMEDKGRTLDVVDRETGEILLVNDEAATFLDKMETMEELQQKKNVSESVKDFSKEEEKQLRGLRMWHGKHAIKDRPYRVNANKNIVCPKCACTEGLSTVWTAIEDFEPDFAKMAGVDISDLMIVRSEYAEQAIDISAEILRSGKCDLMVIDSVAMLTPAKEIEDSAEKFQQGLAARLINKALRRWTAGQTVVDIESNAGTKPTLILINQVRHKIGVMYGCFSHRTHVLMADGATRNIGSLVKARDPGPIMSYDPETGTIESKKIVNWYQNGDADKFLTVKTTALNARGYCTFDATPNHKVFRLGAKDRLVAIEANQLVVGDRMLSSQNKTDPVEVIVTSIKEQTNLDCSMRKYDLEIEDSHTYMVGGPGGVLVHNSPDVMPGGKGQTFANSLVLKFRGGKKTKNEDTGETVNHVIHVKVEKSKVSPPDEQGDFVIWLREHKGNYPGTTSEPKIVFETAIKEGVILKVKNSYMLAGKKYTTQKAAVAALTTDSLLLDATRTMILDRMNDRRLRHA